MWTQVRLWAQSGRAGGLQTWRAKNGQPTPRRARPGLRVRAILRKTPVGLWIAAQARGGNHWRMHQRDRLRARTSAKGARALTRPRLRRAVRAQEPADQHTAVGTGSCFVQCGRQTTLSVVDTNRVAN